MLLLARIRIHAAIEVRKFRIQKVQFNSPNDFLATLFLALVAAHPSRAKQLGRVCDFSPCRFVPVQIVANDAFPPPVQLSDVVRSERLKRKITHIDSAAVPSVHRGGVDLVALELSFHGIASALVCCLIPLSFGCEHVSMHLVSAAKLLLARFDQECHVIVQDIVRQ